MTCQIPKVGDYVKHIYREHNQEAEHMATSRKIFGKASKLRQLGRRLGIIGTAATDNVAAGDVALWLQQSTGTFLSTVSTISGLL